MVSRCVGKTGGKPGGMAKLVAKLVACGFEEEIVMTKRKNFSPLRVLKAGFEEPSSTALLQVPCLFDKHHNALCMFSINEHPQAKSIKQKHPKLITSAVESMNLLGKSKLVQTSGIAAFGHHRIAPFSSSHQAQRVFHCHRKHWMD